MGDAAVSNRASSWAGSLYPVKEGEGRDPRLERDEEGSNSACRLSSPYFQLSENTCLKGF
jgi:hypothetical protein